MATASAKEERKRKRAKDGEDSIQKTKKAKNEKTANGAEKTNFAVDESASSDQVMPIQGVRAEASKTRQSKSDVYLEEIAQQALKSLRDRNLSARNEYGEDDGSQESEVNVQVDSDKLQRRQDKLNRQYRNLIEKFRTIEDQPPDIRAYELRWMLQKSKKIIKKKGLGQDDELVQLRNRHARANRDTWHLSRPIGGRFLSCDPVFSKDEKYIILATANNIHVYEAESSLLLRTMHARGATCYALSAANPHHLYVGTSTGEIHHLDWSTSEKIGRIESGVKVHVRSLHSFRAPNTDEDIILTVETQLQTDDITSTDCVSKAEKKPGDKHASKDVLAIRKAPWNEDAEARHEMLQSDNLRDLQVLDQGRVIIACSSTQMFVGSLTTNADQSSLAMTTFKSKYCWRHLKSTHAITCIDSRVRNPAEDLSNHRSETRIYDIAVGNAKGEILIYEDIIAQLNKLDAGSNQPPRARSLRWHREAPNAIKWSNDGNYLISGGKETVLCIWQLETGRRQDLPHLTAAIQNLTVSPSGASYALHLADNSVLVLSTAELQPKTHIASLQSLCVLSPRPLAQAMRGLSAIPFVNNPRHPNQLLIAVPVDQSVTKATQSIPAAPFLQTYDLQAGRHMTRQALTRNIITEANIDPEWNKIEIPNVTLMEISCDGMWLATVEEWLPPSHALQYLALDKSEIEVERRKRRETYLKIWHWDEERKTWALNTRVGNPHSDDSNELANRTFHLVSHPKEACFATVGEDSCVRVWRPRASIEGETSWHAKLVTKLERNAIRVDEATDFLLPASPVIGRLAFSNDGSVLAVSKQDDSVSRNGIVHLLDSRQGVIKYAETGLAVGYLIAMGFLDRYLIVVSEQLRVWDAVIGSVLFSKPLGRHGLSLSHRLATTHLAISVTSKSFAVAGVNIGSSKGDASAVLVFKPTVAEPVFISQLHTGLISGLSPLSDGTGYIILDSQAELRTLRTHNVPLSGVIGTLESQPNHQLGIAPEDDEVSAGGHAVSSGDDFNDATQPLSIQDESRIRETEKLARVFTQSYSGLGLPSVKEMFDSVAGLFASKSK
ncbi:uncharacterized protein PV09_08570 [Verruconis gallopava]|uniref:WD repeat-containing protein 75 second beta-propeller domain-containing protein n=1 Tax=Verruconis gallopava TaxID=253628 RepID=A0A0D2A0B5_9PEZI|nr:uncharacterized protein PV09_08570 [Verruconis gallopava]KIV99764.1 hypothetical protein PV09_08570 [Verruconis gallopava]